MRKNVFVKYLMVFVVIILLSFMVLTIINNSLIRNYAVNTKREEAGRTSSLAGQMLSLSYRSGGTNRTFEEYISDHPYMAENMLKGVIGESEDRLILVTELTGKVLLKVSLGLEDELLSAVVQIPQETMTQLLSAEEGRTNVDGVLFGVLQYHTVTGTRVIYDSDGNPVGAAFCCESTRTQDRMIATVNRSIFTASVWVMIASIIAVYFLSDRVIAPLRQVTRAVKEYGEGNLDARVSIKGDDEIAELGHAFNSMAESMAHTEKMRNSFLANVSHDLRTPMTTIAGFVDGMLAGTIPQEKQGEYLEIVSSEAHRLSRLVAQLLDISKLESGDRKFTCTSFDICETARLVLISLEQKIEDKHLEVQFECEEDSMMVYSDKDAIHQVLYNLCDNAQKFAKDGCVLRLSIKRGDIGKLLVSVYNEGEGVPEEDVPYIFDRFYKSDKSRGLDKTGTGLGLYIVKTILESLHEKITLTSESGVSCEFVFTISQDNT